MKPLIGVLPLWDSEKESYWMLPGYMHGIEAAGGVPVMLPLTTDTAILERFTAICAGFLFTGGQDVSPELYGDKKRFENIDCCAMRDEMEEKLLRSALAADKAVFGICRGIQFINAALGGTLFQDLPAEHPSELEHHQHPPYDRPVHKVKIIKGTPLFDLLKKEALQVNSYHHQAIKTLAPELKAMATAQDGICEGVYIENKKFVWAVQWHPEFSYKTDADSMALFKAFVNAAAAE